MEAKQLATPPQIPTLPLELPRQEPQPKMLRNSSSSPNLGLNRGTLLGSRVRLNVFAPLEIGQADQARSLRTRCQDPLPCQGGCQSVPQRRPHRARRVHCYTDVLQWLHHGGNMAGSRHPSKTESKEPDIVYRRWYDDKHDNRWVMVLFCLTQRNSTNQSCSRATHCTQDRQWQVSKYHGYGQIPGSGTSNDPLSRHIHHR